ncbi:mRNA cleavage and polyadenylation specificity factor-like protein [Halomicrococcus sp. SG-WS-1]|uniref:mRNA cleavage and polyadenylation specificity factor-like protein n=1 Tax=Halomicrococcus sp. SG-WS-1 TaxID=3439057 RepID=UPI003F79CDAD
MIRRKDGIHVEAGGSLGTVVADARSAVGDVNVVSHAHADHTFRRTPPTVCCSATTAALVEARTGARFAFTDSVPGIELLPAGHVVGSRAALVADETSDRSVLYTGDFSTRDRLYLSGFDPVPADVLVMETTYGDPAYRFPEQSALEGEIRDWLSDHDEPLFLFGYSLGRAQKLQKLARQATNRPLVASDAIREVDDAIEAATGVTFDADPFDASDLAGDEIVFLPSNQARSDWVDDLVERVGGLKVGFSGWAVDESFRYRGGYDRTFPLSDHCDFDELLAVVEAVDPETVYTHHGFDESFAAALQKRGYEARPLLRDQTALSEFS